ncbi:MAG: hypothetical protein JSR82_22555 [Verrucomicrobia bacterium]|nr:hypothetical protein [Verrucomicrobiota bacterium]
MLATFTDELVDAFNLERRAQGFRTESEFICALVRQYLLHPVDMTLPREMACLSPWERDKLDVQILQAVRERCSSKRRHLSFDELGVLVAKAKERDH